MWSPSVFRLLWVVGRSWACLGVVSVSFGVSFELSGCCCLAKVAPDAKKSPPESILGAILAYVSLLL